MSQTFELTEDDHVRLGEIRAMKRTALAVLLASTLVFLVATLLEHHQSSTWGYLRATAEAAMVGGIADWFAVTALFRHPLGIPIPHTAILPNRKDQLGRTIGSFVTNSFLSPTVVNERLATFSVSDRVADWLEEPGNAEIAAERASTLLSTVARFVDDEEVGRLLSDEVLDRLRAMDVAPLAGRVLDLATEDGRHHQLLDAALRGVGDMLAEQRGVLRRRFEAESPWWVPGSVDDAVFERIYNGINTFIDEIRSNPDHEVRRHVDAKMQELSARLRESPELAERANELKRELLDHPAVAAWATDIWAELRTSFSAQATDPDSKLRSRLTDAAGTVAHALATDPELRATVDAGAADLASTLAERYGGEVARFVESTVQRWDATETSTRVELLLGRDLQIIRINGSVVGGLAGLVIYSIAQLLT